MKAFVMKTTGTIFYVTLTVLALLHTFSPETLGYLNSYAPGVLLGLSASGLYHWIKDIYF